MEHIEVTSKSHGTFRCTAEEFAEVEAAMHGQSFTLARVRQELCEWAGVPQGTYNDVLNLVSLLIMLASIDSILP